MKALLVVLIFSLGFAGVVNASSISPINSNQNPKVEKNQILANNASNQGIAFDTSTSEDTPCHSSGEIKQEKNNHDCCDKQQHMSCADHCLGLMSVFTFSEASLETPKLSNNYFQIYSFSQITASGSNLYRPPIFF